ESFGKGETPEIRLFRVAQLVAEGEIASRPTLPSFLYFPTESEYSSGRFRLGRWYPAAKSLPPSPGFATRRWIARQGFYPGEQSRRHLWFRPSKPRCATWRTYVMSGTTPWWAKHPVLRNPVSNVRRSCWRCRPLLMRKRAN